MRVLDRDEPRARHVHRRSVPHQRAHIVPVETAGKRSDRPRHETAVDRGTALLGEEDVRVLLGEQLVARLGQDATRDLVRHARGREIDSLLLAQQHRRTPLQLENGRILAFLLVADLRIRHRVAHATGRLGRGIRAKIDHARNLAVFVM